MPVSFGLGDIVRMKKPHACGENRWEVIRMGMDIRIKCQRCGHSVLIPRARFERLIRAVLEKGGTVGEGEDSVSD
ncbi:DUF951 domain-containing protein [Alicyclobacillus sendaiensis]|uniref:DUF951 domain-containing protein n=1 Tax=Alicyclobacillus sendaiensis PA2 TaxID=3029425 RepID=A0ABT6XY40_ALISE|nr:DUF951 domain-containing protein [Alicyclobacillus sendaiensis]MDI9259697.1 DUF951 domain-containing protein [Alicyclobacillus sendaiensis PA2]